MSVNRILIVGWGRAGKDTAAEMLSRITGIPYAGSTSWAAKEIVARELGIHPQMAWETRHQNRDKWKAICDEYRAGCQTVLIWRALASVNEEKSSGITAGWRGIVAGVRDAAELRVAKEEQLFDKILWIHRPETPKDPTVTFTAGDCDCVIMNNGTLDELHKKLFLFAETFGAIPALYLSGKTRNTEDIFRE